MDNIDLVYSFFSQFTFKIAKDNIDLIMSYFRRQIPGGRNGNKLIFDLLEAIKSNKFEDIDYPLFNEILARNGKTAAESQYILSEILRWKQYSKEQLEPTRRLIKELISTTIIQRANELFPNDSTGYLKYIKSSDINIESNDMLFTQSFMDLDDALVTAEIGVRWQTPWKQINDCFRPALGLSPALYCVTAPPGTGKSLFLANIACCVASQGAKVHLLILGDLSQKDLVIRMSSILSGNSFETSASNISESLKILQNHFGTNISMTVLPSGKLKPEEYLEFISDKQFDVLIVDYDSNFLNEQVTENMYLAGGTLYDGLTTLSKNKVVLVASQPKIYSWSQEVIGLGDLSESSRKAHIIDALFAISKCPDSNQSCGIINIAKNRRGRDNIKFPYVRLNNGRFKLIPKGVYEYIKNVQEYHDWLDSEIDQYILSYTQHESTIQKQVQSKMANLNGKSPFK